MQCGVVQCGAVWCGAVWCGAVWSSVVGLVQCVGVQSIRVKGWELVASKQLTSLRPGRKLLAINGFLLDHFKREKLKPISDSKPWQIVQNYKVRPPNWSLLSNLSSKTKSGIQTPQLIPGTFVP